MEGIKKGALVIITSGEYSSYTIDCLCEALVDINPRELMVEYCNFKGIAIPIPFASKGWERFEYLSWLINEKKCFKEIDYTEIEMPE